jgi:hypothetical protein
VLAVALTCFGLSGHHILCALAYNDHSGTVAMGSSAIPQEPSDSFPLSQGTYWIYSGTVNWFDFASNKEAIKSVRWKTEIERVFRHGDIVAAVVREFPSDLDWSEGNPKPTEAIMVRRGPSEIYLFGRRDLQPDLSRIEDPNDSLAGLLTVDDLLLKLPLHSHEKYCDPEGMERTDDSYC